MTIAVSAATGHLGRLVIQTLLKTEPGDSLVAIVRDASKAQGLVELGVQLRIATYDDSGALLAALEGVDRLLMISGSEVGRRVAQHTNIIRAAESAGVSFVVYTSATDATNTPLILAPEHKATEELLAESSLPHSIVRNGWYTENYEGMLETARHTGEIVAAVGDGRVASASRIDYAEGAVAVLLADGGDRAIYEFSGDYAWDFHELAEAFSLIIGKTVVFRPVDEPTLVGILTGGGLDEDTAAFVAALDGNISQNLLKGGPDDLTKAIGRPTTPLLNGLKAMVS